MKSWVGFLSRSTSDEGATPKHYIGPGVLSWLRGDTIVVHIHPSVHGQCTLFELLVEASAGVPGRRRTRTEVSTDTSA